MRGSGAAGARAVTLVETGSCARFFYLLVITHESNENFIELGFTAATCNWFRLCRAWLRKAQSRSGELRQDSGGDGRPGAQYHGLDNFTF